MRNLHLILVLATSLLPLTTAQAAPADQPETGQTSCSDTTGTVIACAGTGQDGEHRAGVAWPDPRFTVGTGSTADCVTDNLTGLMWVRVPDSIPDTWTNALASANNLTLCGFDDWRLPNINELESLVNSQAVVPARFLNTSGFTGVQPGEYWSSTSRTGAATFADSAWYVGMESGEMSATPKFTSNFFLPVRTAQ